MAETQWVKAWLARDGQDAYQDCASCCYLVFLSKPGEKDESGLWPSENQYVALCAEVFERLFPHYLEPGGGPIEVEVAIRVREPDANTD